MNEQEPKYFTSFRSEFGEFTKEINGKLNSHLERFDRLDKKIAVVGEELKIVDQKLDTHFEQIGKVTVQVTEINIAPKKKGIIEDEETPVFDREIFV